MLFFFFRISLIPLLQRLTWDFSSFIARLPVLATGTGLRSALINGLVFRSVRGDRRLSPELRFFRGPVLRKGELILNLKVRICKNEILKNGSPEENFYVYEDPSDGVNWLSKDPCLLSNGSPVSQPDLQCRNETEPAHLKCLFGELEIPGVVEGYPFFVTRRSVPPRDLRFYSKNLHNLHPNGLFYILLSI